MSFSVSFVGAPRARIDFGIVSQRGGRGPRFGIRRRWGGELECGTGSPGWKGRNEKCPSGFRRVARAAPAGARPPLGQNQHNLPPASSANNSRFPLRTCLRKGCERSFVPHRWNQRYCRDAACRRLLRRWQAAKRQQRRRSRAEVRQQRAAAAKQRRGAMRSAGRSSRGPSCSASEPATPSRAWSRRRKNSASFCDRPGCYEALRAAHRCVARYCGDTCCQTQRRVRDRERKWLRRKTSVGQFKRALEYEARRRARERQRDPAVPVPAPPDRTAVLDSRERSDSSVSCRDPQEVPAHDPETSASTRPRPPPAA